MRTDATGLLKLREAFPSLPSKKIIKMHEISNPNNKSLNRPKLYMTTKGPSRKHILVLLDNVDKEKIFSCVNEHIALINSLNHTNQE